MGYIAQGYRQVLHVSQVKVYSISKQMSTADLVRHKAKFVVRGFEQQAGRYFHGRLL